MSTILAIDETSGSQNTSQGGVTANDTGNLTVPSLFDAALTAATVDESGATRIGVALSGYTGSGSGSTVLSFGSNVQDIFFASNANGDPVNGVDSGLKTLDGTTIYLYTSLLNNNVVLGRAGSSSGNLVFALYLDTVNTGGTSVNTSDGGDVGATASKVWLAQYQPIQHIDAAGTLTIDESVVQFLTNKLYVGADSLVAFDLTNAPSGQNLFLTVGDGSPATGEAAIVITGLTANDTVNTSQAGSNPIVVGTNNQMIVPTKGLYVSYVTLGDPDGNGPILPDSDYTVPNLTSGEASLASNIKFDAYLPSTGGGFTIVQTQPNNGPVQLLLTAINETDGTEEGTSYFPGLTDGDESAVNVSTVTITRGGIEYTASATTGVVTLTNDNGTPADTSDDLTLANTSKVKGKPVVTNVTVDFTGNTAFINGLLAGDHVDYIGDSHNRVKIVNAAASDGTAFDIGEFSIRSGSVTAQLLEDVAFVDDEPTVSANTAAQLDDDALTGGNAGGTGDVDPDTANLTGTLGHSYGADGQGSVKMLDTGATLPTGFYVGVNGTGTVLTVYQGTSPNGTAVLSVTLTDTTSGAYTVAQLAAIAHPAGSNENNLDFTLAYQVTDRDGDTANGTLAINVDDDTPTVSANTAAQLDDDALTGGNAGGTGDVDPDTANLTGTLGHSYGADGQGTVKMLDTGATLPTGFYVGVNGTGTVLTVYQGTSPNGTAVLSVTLTDTTSGAYTVAQLAAIAHPAGSNENNLDFTLAYQVTDGDGDTANGTLAINVDDDTPTVSANTAAQLDDDALTGGNAGGTGDVDPDTANLTGTLGHSYGADGAGTVKMLDTGATLPTGFYVGVNAAGTVLTVYQGTSPNGTAVLSVTLSDTTSGAYTVAQLAPISHPAGSNENNLDFTLAYQVTDGDGDTANGTLAINVDDDTPTVSSNLQAKLDDDALTGGNAGGTGDDINAENLTGTLGHSYGADGAGTVKMLDTGATLPTGFYVGVNAAGTVLTVYQGTSPNGTAVLSVTLTDTTSGAYTVAQLAAIAHPTGSTENNLDFTLAYQVTDADGDTADGTLAINVDDDTPTLNFGNLVGTGTDLAQYGFWGMSPGADGANTDELQVSLTGFSLGGVAQASGNFSLTEGAFANGAYQYNGSLTGDFDNNAGTPNTTITFTLSANPTTGKYALDLSAPVGSTTTTDTANGGLGAGGPDAVQTLYIPPPPATPTETVVFFSAKWDATANAIKTGVISGATDPTEASLQGNNPPTTFASFIDPRSMNVSTAGIGVDNNNLNGYGLSGNSAVIDDYVNPNKPSEDPPADESFVVNPLSLVDKVRVFIDNSQPYEYSDGDRLMYRIIYENNTISDYVTVTGDLGKGAQPKYFEIDGAGQKIDAVQLTMAYGVIKVPNIQFVTITESLANDISLDFTATLTDKDGDAATSNFSADLFTNEAAGSTFDFELLGTASVTEAFDIDLASTRNDYKVTGFDVGTDTLVFIGAGAGVGTPSTSFDGTNSLVTVLEEPGGQTTSVTVMGVDLTGASNYIVFA